MVHKHYALVIGFPEEGDPGLMGGVCKLCISKFLYFPNSGGILSCKVPSYLANPTGFRTLFWFFEQLANTRTLHSDENSTLINFLLNTTLAARKLLTSVDQRSSPPGCQREVKLRCLQRVFTFVAERRFCPELRQYGRNPVVYCRRFGI